LQEYFLGNLDNLIGNRIVTGQGPYEPVPEGLRTGGTGYKPPMPTPDPEDTIDDVGVMSSAESQGVPSSGQPRRHLSGTGQVAGGPGSPFSDTGGPSWDTENAEGQKNYKWDIRNLLDSVPDYVAGLSQDQGLAGDALRSSLSSYYNVNSDGTLGSERAIDASHPLFQNAQDLFQKTSRQAIGNSAALSGLGNSNAKTNAIATGWGEQFTPLYSMLSQNQQAGKQFATQGLMDYGSLEQANRQKSFDAINAEKTRQRTMAENLSTGLLGGFVPSTIGSKTTGGGLFK